MKQKKCHILETSDSFFEQKRNEFLAALYEEDFQAAANSHEEIFEYATQHPEFSENMEKCLNQIQTACKKFKKALVSHGRIKILETYGGLKTLLTHRIRNMHRNIRHVEFEEWRASLGLNPDQESLLFKTAMTFQLTSGCSHFCRRCNEWALPGVRSHFSHKAAIRVLNRMADEKNSEVSLYGASDPLDWEDRDKNVADLIGRLNTLQLGYSVLTKVPRGKETLFTRLVQNSSNLSVSITSKNKARIETIDALKGASLSKQHDLDELMIPAGLDEDFVSVKPSITDGYGTEITPDGASIIIPTFTSALHPYGHKKIPINGKTDFFPLKKTGRTALLADYFKPLEGYDLHQTPCHLPGLLDVQVESVILDSGSDALTPPGMRSLKEYLSIFDEPARLQREKMTPAVFRSLKQQFLSPVSFDPTPSERKIVYLKKINSHLDLCRPHKCLSAKLYAASFFLNAVLAYQIKNPVKVKMMAFLLKKEGDILYKLFPSRVDKRPIDELLSGPDTDSFNILRFYMISLLHGLRLPALASFLASYPAEYDPITDMFVHR